MSISILFLSIVINWLPWAAISHLFGSTDRPEADPEALAAPAEDPDGTIRLHLRFIDEDEELFTNQFGEVVSFDLLVNLADSEDEEDLPVLCLSPTEAASNRSFMKVLSELVGLGYRTVLK